MTRMINFTDDGRTETGPWPVLNKRGFIADNGGETTPFVWKDRLLRIEMAWGANGIEEKAAFGNHAVIRDLQTGEVLSAGIAPGKRFMTAFAENDALYVWSTFRNTVYGCVTRDLQHWESFTAAAFPESFELFNTSVCKGEGAYLMAVECGAAEGKDVREIGVPFTIFFASSPDLRRWTLLPLENAFGKDRYVACPTLHFSNGMYYMIADEALPFYRFVPYIYRSRDLVTWEVGAINPVLWYSEEDRRPADGYSFSPEFIRKTAAGMNANLSDVELCGFEGKTHVLYVTGNQWGYGGVACEAVYDGPVSRFLESFF